MNTENSFGILFTAARNYPCLDNFRPWFCLSAFASPFFKHAGFREQAAHGFAGKEFPPFCRVVAAAHAPDGQQAGDLGWRQILVQHGQSLLHGFLFVFDNDAHGCSLVKIRINSGGVNVRSGPRYLRINWSSQVMKKSAAALSAPVRATLDARFRHASTHSRRSFARLSLFSKM